MCSLNEQYGRMNSNYNEEIKAAEENEQYAYFTDRVCISRKNVYLFEHELKIN